MIVATVLNLCSVASATLSTGVVMGRPRQAAFDRRAAQEVEWQRAEVCMVEIGFESKDNDLEVSSSTKR